MKPHWALRLGGIILRGHLDSHIQKVSGWGIERSIFNYLDYDSSWYALGKIINHCQCSLRGGLSEKQYYETYFHQTHSNPRLLRVFNDNQWSASPYVSFCPNHIHFSRRAFFKFPLVVCTRVVGAWKPRQLKVHRMATSKVAICIVRVAELGSLELYMLQPASLVGKTAGFHIDAIRHLVKDVAKNTGECR